MNNPSAPAPPPGQDPDDPPAPEPRIVPIAPRLTPRPVIGLLVVCNAIVLLTLLAYFMRWLPLWVILLLGVVLLAGTTVAVIAREAAWKKAFCAARFAEIRPYFESDRLANKRVAKDFRDFAETSPDTSPISWLSLLAAAVLGYLIFIDVNAWLGEWHWLFRIPIALFVAMFGWALFFSIGGAGNLAPALPAKSYLELRKEEESAGKLGPEDINDLHIIEEIASLENLHRRIESYTLESALLSALSFSSFMAIVLSDRDYIDRLKNVFPIPVEWRSPPESLQFLSAIGIERVPGLRDGYITANTVGLISFFLLLCATTFLAVLVARLRFNDGYRDAESMLKTAERLNEKEDIALAAKDVAKAEVCAVAIESMMSKAKQLQTVLSPTVIYMRASRNAGILFFTFALILCGLFFNTGIAVLISLLFVFALAFGYVDRTLRRVIHKRVFDGGLAALLKSLSRRR